MQQEKSDTLHTRGECSGYWMVSWQKLWRPKEGRALPSNHPAK